MTYDYLCSACGHEWEADQRISEPPLEECPACGQKAARRMISGGAGFILKGGGWYSDGYASQSNKPAGNSGSTAKASKTEAPDSSSSKSMPSKTGDSASKSAAA